DPTDSRYRFEVIGYHFPQQTDIDGRSTRTPRSLSLPADPHDADIVESSPAERCDIRQTSRDQFFRRQRPRCPCDVHQPGHSILFVIAIESVWNAIRI